LFPFFVPAEIPSTFIHSLLILFPGQIISGKIRIAFMKKDVKYLISSDSYIKWNNKAGCLKALEEQEGCRVGECAPASKE